MNRSMPLQRKSPLTIVGKWRMDPLHFLSAVMTIKRLKLLPKKLPIKFALEILLQMTFA